MVTGEQCKLEKVSPDSEDLRIVHSVVNQNPSQFKPFPHLSFPTFNLSYVKAFPR